MNQRELITEKTSSRGDRVYTVFLAIFMVLMAAALIAALVIVIV